MVDFDLDDFVDFEALPGPLHNLLHAQAFLEGMAASAVLVGHLEEGDVGPRVSVELLEHLLAELNGHRPILLFGEDLEDAEVDHLPDIGLDCLLDCAGEVSEELFGVDPGDPHVVLVGDGGEVVDGPQELVPDLFGRRGGQEGRDVEEVAFRSRVSQNQRLVELFWMGHGLELRYFLLEFFFLLLVVSCFLGCLLFLLFLRLPFKLLLLIILFCLFLVVGFLFHGLLFFLLLFFLSVFLLNLNLILRQQFLQPFILFLLIACFNVDIIGFSLGCFNGR